jgi:prophage regulatory protein
MPDPLLNCLRPAEVCALLSVSPSTLHRMRQQRDFPAPIRLNKRSIAWREGDINRYLKRNAAESKRRHGFATKGLGSRAGQPATDQSLSATSKSPEEVTRTT